MKPLTSAAFFFAKRPGRGRQAIFNARGRIVGYVRVKMFKGCTALEALDKAKPRRGESVMNTHEI